MEYRELGHTGWKVSAVSFGTGQFGKDWGERNDAEAIAALHHAVDCGVNFFDTADVYGTEAMLGQLRRERREPIYIATKVGRRLNPHLASGYTRENLAAFVDDSLKNLQTEVIDLLQLHTPPTQVFYMPEVFAALDDLVKQGKVRYYGVSVEKVEEGLKAIEYPSVQSVQIVFNMFRQRPSELLFEQARKKRVSILARVPLASGLLTGKMTRQTTFAQDDHRTFNRHGESYDRGETFAGVDFETGVAAVDELEQLVPPGATMTQFALRWILMFEVVACPIPGAKRPSQVDDNTGAADLPPLTEATMARVREIYDSRIRELVHHYW